jgi:hypothetical protein
MKWFLQENAEKHSTKQRLIKLLKNLQTTAQMERKDSKREAQLCSVLNQNIEWKYDLLDLNILNHKNWL